METDIIYIEDCLEGMKRIPDGSVDCIICDPPYGQTHNHWDSVLSFDKMWLEYNRVIKENAAIILFAQGMFTAKLMLSNEKMWKYNLVWKKGDRVSGFLNPQMREGKPLHGRGGGEHRFINNNYGKYSELEDTRAGSTEKYPISVLNFDRPHPPIHPTQKPVELIQYLIRTYTNEGEVVLDNCIGSGTTAIAAIRENRRYIGFEVNEEYYKMAIKRINEEKNG